MDSCRWQRDTRYYEARACADLFGPCVVVNWGRVASRRGGQRTYPCPSPSAAGAELARIGRRRERRGYVLWSVR